MIETTGSIGGLAAAGGTPAVTVTGGSPILVFAVFGLLAIATVLSLVITYRFAQGYRRSGRRALLLLAIGMFLLTAAPIFIRLGFANLGVSGTQRVLTVTATELLGLVIILYTIYR